jgi:hypothetical protein
MKTFLLTILRGICIDPKILFEFGKKRGTWSRKNFNRLLVYPKENYSDKTEFESRIQTSDTYGSEMNRSFWVLIAW